MREIANQINNEDIEHAFKSHVRNNPIDATGVKLDNKGKQLIKSNQRNANSKNITIWKKNIQ